MANDSSSEVTLMASKRSTLERDRLAGSTESWPALLIRWMADNPGAWPVPLLAYLVWQQDRLVWALVERLDTLTEAVRALERAVR
jgi:hypothetical protein